MKQLTLAVIGMIACSSLLAQQDVPSDTLYKNFKAETDYEGGLSGYMRFLNRTLRYPQKAIDEVVMGSVVSHVIIDTTGAVTRAEAISGPELLRDEAARIIKLAPGFIPETINGVKVTTYRSVPIIFRLEPAGSPRKRKKGSS